MFYKTREIQLSIVWHFTIDFFFHQELSERLFLFQAMLEVNGIRIQFSKTDENIDACKTLQRWLLRFGQMPNVDTQEKNNQKSKMLRIQGNKLFQNKEELSKAMDLYNQAICWAESGSEDMAIGFANRSAIYFHWKLYDVCIENINLAVDAGCPGTLLAKLERRRSDCFLKLQNGNKIELPRFGEEVTAHLQVKAVDSHASFLLQRYSFDVKQKRKEPQLSVTANPKIPFIANCLKMESTAVKGRHVVTDADLKPGQIISIEKPYTNSLTKYHRYRKCANCFEENFMNLIPCPSCTCTMFCSKQCLAESEAGFHMYECPVVDLLWTQFEEYALTLRMVHKALTTFDSIDELIEFRKKSKKNPNAKNAFSFDHTNGDVTEKVRYDWVHNLQTNEQFRMDDELLDRCSKVAVLYHHLIEKTRFGNILRTERERDTLMAIILQHTQVSSLNCINCFQYDNVHYPTFTELKPLDVFSRGIYPLSSLFNHSCAPNTATIASGTNMVTYVTRPIKSKEEVTTCYKR